MHNFYPICHYNDNNLVKIFVFGDINQNQMQVVMLLYYDDNNLRKTFVFGN